MSRLVYLPEQVTLYREFSHAEEKALYDWARQYLRNDRNDNPALRKVAELFAFNPNDGDKKSAKKGALN